MPQVWQTRDGWEMNVTGAGWFTKLLEEGEMPRGEAKVTGPNGRKGKGYSVRQREQHRQTEMPRKLSTREELCRGRGEKRG